MTVDFTQPVLLMPDGSYTVILANGWQYNVLQVDPACQWKNLWPDVQAWLTYAPLPQTAAGVGQFAGAVQYGGNITLPAGGTWAWHLMRFSTGGYFRGWNCHSNAWW